MVDFRGHRWRWPTHPGLQNGGDRAAGRGFVFFSTSFQRTMEAVRTYVDTGTRREHE